MKPLTTTGATKGAETVYPSTAPELAPIFSGVRVVHVVQLHVFMYLVPCCDVRYDFRVNVMFGSSLRFVLKGFVLYLCYFCIYLHILASNTLSISDDGPVVEQ